MNLAGYNLLTIVKLIGRSEQQAIFKHCENSTESKLIAGYGRRRVGKTFFIRQYFKSKIVFEIAGLHQVSLAEQLAHFTQSIRKQEPQSWLDAFYLLEQFIQRKKRKGKLVVFLDDLPWFDTPRSRFISAFENFWNSFCTKRTDIICIICGSAASWMIKKIVQNKSGLHNRLSEKIRLTPFTLHETQQFLREKGIQFSQYDITQLYMITGGVPYYLDAIRKGESVGQFADRACFSRDGVLIDEYDILFESLFENSHRHHTIIKALANKRIGLTRKELIAKTKLDSGGTLSQSLHELQESGFIELVSPFQQKKTKNLYKLIDHFVLFYWKFMRNKNSSKGVDWITLMNSQTWIS